MIERRGGLVSFFGNEIDDDLELKDATDGTRFASVD